ncbi:MAG TPA: hypothetical protein VFT37_03985 [Telluria sp.]|nr:hypothetical protein [Telluria sp.]
MKKTLLVSALLALGFAAPVHAETLSANGITELSIKANGDLVNARRIARERAEKGAVANILKIRLNADVNNPKVKAAVDEMRVQLADNLRTSYSAEGDMLTAKTVLQVDSAQFQDLARSYELTSKLAGDAAKVLFLIDEYYGIGTRLDPQAPLTTEIEYSHDKSSLSDHSSSSSGAQSASSSSASAAKGSFAAASSDKSAYAANSSSAVAARDRQAFAGSDKQSFNGSASGSAAYQDGSGSLAASRSVQASGDRDTRVAGSRDAQFAASQKSSAAGSSSSQAAVAANYSSAKAAKSSSSSSFANNQNHVERQNDVVNLKVKQSFPGIDNAKPADESSALISQKLQQVVKEFGLSSTEERDFRVEGGRRLTINEIRKLQKFDSYLGKAAQGKYKAKYLVYGEAVMQSEGQTQDGQVACSGQLKLSSSDVDTGESLVAGAIGKSAVGTSDQNCRTNLADALARSLADTVGTGAQKELQRAAASGRTYTLALYSALKVPGKLRREFSRRVQELEGVVEFGDDNNASEEMRRWTVVAKGNFADNVENLIDEIIEADNSAYKDARFEKRGNNMVFCIEGKCPAEF